MIPFDELTHGELFAGISGFGRGFDRAGLKTVWAVEIDPNCRKVLRHHHPDMLILEDVMKCGVHNLPPVDVISFGSPCQDLSVAGKREGLNGKRSGLYFEAIRIIRELNPIFAVWENVPGALSSNGGRDFGAALDALAESGALDIGWAILDAQWFGVAQRRRRLFVVADFRGRRAAKILSIPYGGAWDSPPSREAGARTAALSASGTRTSRTGNERTEAEMMIVDEPFTFDWQAGSSGDESWRGKARSWIDDKPGRTRALTQAHTLAVAYNIQHNDGGDHKRQDRTNGGMYVNETEMALTVGSTDMTAIVSSTVSSKWAKGTGGPSGDEAQNLIVNAFNGYTGGADDNDAQAGHIVAWRENKQGELSQGDTAKALRSGASHSYQGIGVRRLTPTECEKLQGFPLGWTAVNGQSDSIRYRQLGNAVAVPVAEWIGRRIMESDSTP